MVFEDYYNYDFSTLDRRDLKSYAEYFVAEKDARLQKFIDKIVFDYSINQSDLDFSEKSLEMMDRWLVNHVECVRLTKEEYELVRNTVPDYIDINDWKFSEDTLSGIINVGLYLGEVMIRKHPELKWEQCLKKTIDYGQMIIRIGKSTMNPMRLVYVTCLKIVDAHKTPRSLLEILRVWENYLL